MVPAKWCWTDDGWACTAPVCLVRDALFRDAGTSAVPHRDPWYVYSKCKKERKKSLSYFFPSLVSARMNFKFTAYYAQQTTTTTTRGK
jgi:hypothetical protein